MEYKIVSGFLNKPMKDSISIIDEVNKAMQDGWKPTGGTWRDGHVFHQALIREETISEDSKE